LSKKSILFCGHHLDNQRLSEDSLLLSTSKSTTTVFLSKLVLEYQEYRSTFSKYCIISATMLTFMYRNVHGVMKNVNVNTLENVKGIESKIK